MLGHIFRLASIPLIIIFGMPAVLILISQHSVPGDTMYPIKRQLERAVVFALRINPNAHADYAITLADNRFAEAQSLVVRSGSTKGLADLVAQVTATEAIVAGVTDSTAQETLKEKLLQKLENYDAELTTILLQENIPDATAADGAQPLPVTPPTSEPTPAAPPSPLPIQGLPTPHPTPPLNAPPPPAIPFPIPSPSATRRAPEVERAAAEIKKAKERLQEIRRRLRMNAPAQQLQQEHESGSSTRPRSTKQQRPESADEENEADEGNE